MGESGALTAAGQGKAQFPQPPALSLSFSGGDSAVNCTDDIQHGLQQQQFFTEHLQDTVFGLKMSLILNIKVPREQYQIKHDLLNKLIIY